MSALRYRLDMPKSKRQKGCALCKAHKFKDHGQSIRKPLSELRKLGKSKRISRHDLGDAA